MVSNTCALITLPDKQYSKITRKHEPQTIDKIKAKGPLSDESTYMGLRPMLYYDQDIFGFHLIVTEPTEYFNINFCTSVLKKTIFTLTRQILIPHSS